MNNNSWKIITSNRCHSRHRTANFKSHPWDSCGWSPFAWSRNSHNNNNTAVKTKQWQQSAQQRTMRVHRLHLQQQNQDFHWQCDTPTMIHSVCLKRTNINIKKANKSIIILPARHISPRPRLSTPSIFYNNPNKITKLLNQQRRNIKTQERAK